jgi:hypothetical protein
MREPRYALCLIALLAALSSTGCASASRVTYIPEGTSYTAESLTEALQSSDPGPAADVSTEEASDVRQSALADLRSQGDDAALLADVLTTEFPADVSAVPYAAEHGTYEDRDAWIVFEAWGEADAKLSGRRVWVFAYDDLAVIAAQSIR